MSMGMYSISATVYDELPRPQHATCSNNLAHSSSQKQRRRTEMADNTLEKIEYEVGKHSARCFEISHWGERR